MRIGGLQKLTLIDYPGKIAATIFTQGCNFRCGYCHNPELVLAAKYDDLIPEEIVLKFLEKRKGQLEGVVVTGGEPTVQHDLIAFLYKVKTLGYAVKLDTNGSNPDILKKIVGLKLIDYIAMDVKSCARHYAEAAGKPVDLDAIRASISTVLHCGLPYQFRTTLVKPVCPASHLAHIATLIPDANHWILQEFIPSEKIIDRELLNKGHYTRPEVESLRALWEKIPV